MTKTPEQKRVAVIGGGPGGYVAAIRAAQLGASVTLIEKDTVGGTCLNVGCIPTKALLHTAKLFDDAKNGASCGVKTEVTLDFTTAQSHKSSIVKKLVTGVTGLLKAAKVTVIKGEACFEDARTLRIKKADVEESMQFDDIIIATGSVPSAPPIPGADSPCCIDSTGALALQSVPASLAIIGGGVIGVEFATIYATLGAKVTIIEMMDTILPMMDKELTPVVATALEKKGVSILTGVKVTGIKGTSSGGEISVSSPKGEQVIKAEKVLVAVGRKACTENLGLEKTGVQTERGCICVDSSMQSSVPSIYAIGDCNGQIMLAHVASAQGEIAAENIMGHKAVFSALTNPSCVYTDPEFAGVGLTEEEAEKRGGCIVGRFPFAANGKALAMGEGSGMIKIIAGKNYKEILGVHIVGPRATDLIAEAALAIGLECTVDEIAAVIHAHPTLAEAFREAVLAVDKRAIHMPN